MQSLDLNRTAKDIFSHLLTTNSFASRLLFDAEAFPASSYLRGHVDCPPLRNYAQACGSGPRYATVNTAASGRDCIVEGRSRMSYLHASADGLSAVFTIASLIGLVIGIAWGLVISFMPGVGGVVAIALLLPFVFRLSVPEAIALLLGTHIATYFGGSITSITLNIPASAKSVPLCWDGYPLARRGRGAYALGASATASSLGGVVGAVALTAGIPIMKSLLNVIGPPEIFILAVWGVVIIAIFSSGDLLKGVMAGGLGVLLSWVGASPITGVDRLTFGSTYLSYGIDFATAAIGLFAVGQVLRMLVEGRQTQAGEGDAAAEGAGVTRPRRSGQQTDTTWSGGLAVLRHWRLSLYLSMFGVFTGTVPGLGAPVAAVAAYGQAAQMSKDRANFGKGAIDGVIAPEATDAAAEGGGMLPMLALGIPTHEQQAILLSGFVVLGLAPGPTMLSDHLNSVFNVIWIIVVASLIVGLLGMLAGKYFARLTTLTPSVLVPVILVVAMVGAFAVNGRIGDSITTIIFGIAGYFCLKFNYSRVNLVIGIALGPIFETNLHLTTQLYGNDFIFHRPAAAILAVFVIATVVWWFWKGKSSGRISIEGEGIASAAAKSGRPGWATVAVALLWVALFALVTAISATYGLLTGAVMTVVAAFCLTCGVINAALVVRAQFRQPPAGTSGQGPALALSVAVTSPVVGNFAESPEGSDVVALGNREPARFAGGAAARSVDEAGVAGGSAGGENYVPGGPAAPGSDGSDIPADGSRSLLASVKKRYASRGSGGVTRTEFASMAIVVGFLVSVLLFGMTPGVGIAVGIYRFLNGWHRPLRALVAAVLWAAGVSFLTWLLFHTLVSQYFPYLGLFHIG